MTRTALLSCMTAASITWKHIIVDTAVGGVDVSIPEFITFAALFFNATFLGVRVVVGSAGLSCLGASEVCAVGVAVPAAVELVLRATPFVADEVLAGSHGVVGRIAVVWVVGGWGLHVVAAACHVLVLTIGVIVAKEGAAFTVQDALVPQSVDVTVHVTREAVVTALVVVGVDLLCQVVSSSVQDINQLYDLVED